jgi:hypothetical protein
MSHDSLARPRAVHCTGQLFVPGNPTGSALILVLDINRVYLNVLSI